MTSSGNSVVVWEWMNEYGRWRPYDPHTANFIESSHRKSPSVQVSLGKVAPNMGMYSVDFLTMCQIRFGTGTARPVRRQLYPDSSPPGKGIIWQWEGDIQGQWNSFDMEVSCLLEDHFSNPATQNTELNLSQTTVKLPYIMNLSNMTQKRIETGRLRTIRRELLSMPYLNSIPSDGTSSSSGATNGQGIDTSAVNGPSGAKRQRLSGNGQVSSNPSICGGTTGPITRKRLYTHMMAQNSPLPTSVHMNSSSQIPTNQISHPMPQSLQVTNQNGQIMPVQNPHSLTNQTQLPSGISSSGFVPHSSMFQRAMNFIHGNIPHGMGLAGGSSNNVTYHSLPSQPVGGSKIRPRMASTAANLLMSAVNSLVPQSNTSPGLQPSTSTGAARGTTGFYLPPEDKIPNNVSRQTAHSSGKWAGCEVFEKYVSILDSPPNDEDCCICCEKLTHPSGYGEGKTDEKVVFKLCKCGHMFHKLCILAMYESSTKNGAVQCPTCKTIYGEKHGNCPDGVMEYLTLPQSLPGNEDHQTKIVIYHISPGIQGPEHPHPGKRYTCRGFPRVCYIPDSDKGRKVLKLLIIAWRRRLTFTIGQSSTTGESDTVTWNEIHHKTESGRNHSGHGYPDNKYLDNVLMELNVHGVTEADLLS